MTALADRKCVPVAPGEAALAGAELERLQAELGDRWRVLDGRRLVRELRFPDFRSALAFVDRVGEIAEAEDHHPEIRLGWGHVGIEIWTHTVDGLTENDFVLAAKIDRVG